jgi:hypothetical protein
MAGAGVGEFAEWVALEWRVVDEVEAIAGGLVEKTSSKPAQLTVGKT